MVQRHQLPAIVEHGRAGRSALAVGFVMQKLLVPRQQRVITQRELLRRAPG